MESFNLLVDFLLLEHEVLGTYFQWSNLVYLSTIVSGDRKLVIIIEEIKDNEECYCYSILVIQLLD